MTDLKNDLDALVQETTAITTSIRVEPPVQSATKFDSTF
jgi:hypothetical protein